MSAENTQHVRRGDGINIPRGEILAGIAGYDQAAQEDLLWLHGYAAEALSGSRSALVEWLQVDWTTVTRIWRGTYPAGIDQFLERVRHLRRKAEAENRSAFVETPITRKIFQLCDFARDQGAMVMVSGPTGRSKTHGILAWRRQNNHGRALYCYAPEHGGFSAFLAALARSMSISGRNNNRMLADTIEHGLDYRNVLLIDEVAHLMPGGRGPTVQSLEFIRGLHDRTGCGVVLVATDLFEDQMAGGRWARWFEQLAGRVELHLRIPQRFGRGEIAEICAAYVEEPDPDLIRTAAEIANARQGGVRELFRHLGRAALAAGKLGQPLAARHLAAAYQYARNLIEVPKD